MVHPAGFEPTTPWFEAKYSNPLSYGCSSTCNTAVSALPKKQVCSDNARNFSKPPPLKIPNIPHAGLVWYFG